MRRLPSSWVPEKPTDALPHEQQALQQLMRAESLFREIQVSFAAQGAGGSGSQANAEDLFRAGGAEVYRACQSTPFQMKMSGSHEIVQDREPCK
jgi:hypothetical protein